MGGNVIIGCASSAIIGGLILAMALWQMRTGNVRWLHGYHYVNVPRVKRAALARESGRWMAVAGVCVVLLGLSLLLPRTAADVAGVALVVAVLGAIFMACRVIVKYNGSLFG